MNTQTLPFAIMMHELRSYFSCRLAAINRETCFGLCDQLYPVVSKITSWWRQWHRITVRNEYPHYPLVGYLFEKAENKFKIESNILIKIFILLLLLIYFSLLFFLSWSNKWWFYLYICLCHNYKCIYFFQVVAKKKKNLKCSDCDPKHGCGVSGHYT